MTVESIPSDEKLLQNRYYLGPSQAQYRSYSEYVAFVYVTDIVKIQYALVSFSGRIVRFKSKQLARTCENARLCSDTFKSVKYRMKNVGLYRIFAA